MTNGGFNGIISTRQRQA